MDKKLTKMAEQFKDGRRPPYLTQEEFDGLLRSEPLADFDTFDDRHLGERNLIRTGMTMKGLVWFIPFRKHCYLFSVRLTAL